MASTRQDSFASRRSPQNVFVGAGYVVGLIATMVSTLALIGAFHALSWQTFRGPSALYWLKGHSEPIAASVDALGAGLSSAFLATIGRADVLLFSLVVLGLTVAGFVTHRARWRRAQAEGTRVSGRNVWSILAVVLMALGALFIAGELVAALHHPSAPGIEGWSPEVISAWAVPGMESRVLPWTLVALLVVPMLLAQRLMRADHTLSSRAAWMAYAGVWLAPLFAILAWWGECERVFRAWQAGAACGASHAPGPTFEAVATAYLTSTAVLEIAAVAVAVSGALALFFMLLHATRRCAR